MKGSKGYARDYKTKHKAKEIARVKTECHHDLVLVENEYDAMEFDFLDRKTRRSHEMAEKRRCRRENRDTRRAIKNAASLQRTVRRLMKELPSHPVISTYTIPIDNPRPIPTDHSIHPANPTIITPSSVTTTDTITQLSDIESVLTEAVQKVQTSDWDHVEDLPFVVTTTIEEKKEEPEAAKEPISTIQRLKNWLW